MLAAEQFQGVMSTIFTSPDAEVIFRKQQVLGDHALQTRFAINQFAPEVSHGLLQTYGETPTPLLALMENGITSREFAIDNINQGADLDQQWMQNANNRRMDEVGLSADDDWNTPAL